MHYDPRGASAICKAAIRYYIQKPYALSFLPIIPAFVGVYSDASHSRKTHRANTGVWIQLQLTEEPEERNNPISWSSSKLAKLYDSVYAAEVQAAKLALLHYLEVRSSIEALHGTLQPILFIDNKAAVQSLNSDKRPHPFASESVDFVRQELSIIGGKCKWVCSQGN